MDYYYFYRMHMAAVETTEKYKVLLHGALIYVNHSMKLILRRGTVARATAMVLL